MTKMRLEFIKSVAHRHKQIREGDKPITPGEVKNLAYVMESVLFECIKEIEKLLKEEKPDSNNDRLDIIEVDY